MGRILAEALLILLFPVNAGGQESLPSGPEVKKSLDRILSSKEYSTGVPDPNREATFWEWLLEKIGGLLGKISVLGQSSPAVFWLILTVCVGLLLAIFAHGGVILFRSLRAARVGPQPEEERNPRKEDARALLERALREAGEGRFTEAIRSCHRAALLELDRRGLVRFHESLTSGDYRRQLGARARERKAYDALTGLFEPAYFGGVPAGAAEFAETLRLAQVLGREDAA